MQRGLFGTSGIRGDSVSLFTKEFCVELARTFVEFLKKTSGLSSIAIGSDTRESSPRIKSELFLGLSSAGVELFDEGVVPIPSINWLIKNTQTKAAIMVTGSHIAPQLNGVKFYAHDEEISEEDGVLIESIYREIKGKSPIPTSQANVTVETKAGDLYKTHLIELAGSLRKMKVALDCANGGQSTVFPYVLKTLGMDVVEVNCDPESDFIARDTDTDDKAVIEKLSQEVIANACDFGIAFDGDGDRVVFIDENGKFIQGEYSCSLIAKSMGVDPIVTTISASQVVDTIGKKVYRTKVGSPFVIGKMKDVSSKFGFEPNGGAIFADSMYTRDGGTMAVQMLKLFSSQNSRFSDMFNAMPHFFMKRTKVDYKWEQKDEIINKVKETFKGVKVEETDGIKIWFDETTWILFRSSANAPEFRVFAESSVEDKSVKLLEEGINLVKSITK